MKATFCGLLISAAFVFVAMCVGALLAQSF